MPDYPHLPEAPIQEAVIDLRVKLPKRFDPHSFRAAQEPLAGSFPNMKERRAWLGRLEVGGEPEIVQEEVRSGLEGYVFESEDGKTLAQFRVDGFSFHRMAPYRTWQELVGGAAQLWPVYAGVAEPEAVVRIAVRYINRFDVPLPTELSEHLVTSVNVPRGVDGTLTNFLWKVGFTERDSPFQGTMTQASEVNADGRSADIIVDIDCFAEGSFGAGDEAIWDTLGGLRELKNRIFFNAITPKAVERFA